MIWLVSNVGKPWSPKARTLEVTRTLVEAATADEAMAQCAKKWVFGGLDYQNAVPAEFPLSLLGTKIDRPKDAK
jgi:hypothetical protein